MKMTDKQRNQYYEAQGIDRRDLLSAEDITLAELPLDVHLEEPNRSIVEQFIVGWNGLDPMSKIEAARAMEIRVLKPPRSSAFDMHIPALAWAAYLQFGRIRGGEAVREVMEKIGRGELTPDELRRARSRGRRKAIAPTTDKQRRDAAAFLAPIHARMQAQGCTGVRRETTQKTDEHGDTITIHHVRLTRD